MLGSKRQSRIERVTDALSDAIVFTDEMVRNQRLRSDLRAAIDHGQRAGHRVREDVGANGVTSRLASDKRLRKNLRALVDDLESAGTQLRRRRSHRVRNALLVVAGTGAVVALAPGARHWIAERLSGGDDLRGPDLATV
jgi:hypothetical protein